MTAFKSNYKYGNHWDISLIFFLKWLSNSHLYCDKLPLQKYLSKQSVCLNMGNMGIRKLWVCMKIMSKMSIRKLNISMFF